MSTTITDSTTDAPSARRYPRRLLRGPVTVTHSSRLKFPKLHLVDDCDSLERTPLEARVTRTYGSALELGLDATARPCRNCALESVLLTALKVRAGDPLVFVTATSQGNPLDPGGSLRSYNWRASTDSGRARLERLASRLALPLAHTAVGPALFGFVPARGADVLRWNLRTVVKPEVTELLAAEVVECAWALLGDNPPELGMLEPDALDPWVLAQALVH